MITDEQRNFSKKVNMDKAKIKTSIGITTILLSILTYINPLLYGDFDFGMIFEVISMVSLIISRKYMNEYNLNNSKIFTICSLASIGWILIYDLIVLITSIESIIDIEFLGYEFYFEEFLLITYIINLFAIIRDLNKADNPEKYKESTDWFYEKYEEKSKNDK